MTAAAISEMNSRSPRVVGMRKAPTRSASGYATASHVMVASVQASSTKKIAVGSVQAIHAMFSMAAPSHPAERETARDVVADEPDHQCARNDGQHAGGGEQSPIHAGGGHRARHHRRNRFGV